jgi:hypothetical protein
MRNALQLRGTILHSRTCLQALIFRVILRVSQYIAIIREKRTQG